jgi:hypothetical protein
VALAEGVSRGFGGCCLTGPYCIRSGAQRLSEQEKSGLGGHGHKAATTTCPQETCLPILCLASVGPGERGSCHLLALARRVSLFQEPTLIQLVLWTSTLALPWAWGCEYQENMTTMKLLPGLPLGRAYKVLPGHSRAAVCGFWKDSAAPALSWILCVMQHLPLAGVETPVFSATLHLAWPSLQGFSLPP